MSNRIESVEAREDKMHDDISALQYRVSMGEEKIQAILDRHKKKMHQKIIKSLEEGWRTWPTQAAELQMFRVDQENIKKEG